MAQRIRPQPHGGGGGNSSDAAAAPSTSKRKRALQDISEEHSCVGVSTRQQSSSVSSSRRSQQAPRRPSPMAPRRSTRNSRRVNAHQAAVPTIKTRGSSSNSNSVNSSSSSSSGRRTRSSSSAPRGAATASGRAAAVSCKQEEEAEGGEGVGKDDDGSMSCDEDLEGMVVDLSFEGVADDGEAEPAAPQRRRRRSSSSSAAGGGAERCGGGEEAGGKRACGEGVGGGGDPAAAAPAAIEGVDGADSRRRNKDSSSCSSQPPLRPPPAAAAAAQQRVDGARKPQAQQQQEQLPPGVNDIDAGVSEEGESHLLNPDYVKEHALYLREQEKRNRPSAYIGTKQKDMRPSMRSVLVDWICEVCDQFKLSSRTLFQAVDLIDRSLSAFDVPRGKLQLLGCACVVLASKYEEIYAPTAEELAHISDNTYTRAEIIAMELVVVNALQFRLTCITPCNFQDRFCLAAKSNARERSLVSYLLELLLQDYQGVTLLPSLKAAAALYLARQTLHPRGCPREAWTRQTEHYTGYGARELEPCVRRLHYLHVRAEANNLHAVRDKYKKSALHRVAEVTCALEDYLHFGEEGDVRQ